MDFLQLAGKRILVFGVANRKSVAWQTGKVLEQAGAEVIYVVRSEARKESLLKLSVEASIYVCDVEHQEQIDQLATEIGQKYDVIHGLVHSIAFADYSAGWLPFHETPRAAFLQAVDISCFSLTALSNAFKDLLDPEQGSVVTISISTTRMAAENYGYMAPVKAALDSSICFLAICSQKRPHFENQPSRPVKSPIRSPSCSAHVPQESIRRASLSMQAWVQIILIKKSFPKIPDPLKKAD